MDKEMVSVIIHVNAMIDINTMTREQACDVVRNEITSRNIDDGEIQFVSALEEINFDTQDLIAFDDGKVNPKVVIANFMNEIKDYYENIEMTYYYSEYLNTHMVRHNRKDLDRTSEFEEVSGKAILDHILENDIFNFSFTYADKGEWNIMKEENYV